MGKGTMIVSMACVFMVASYVTSCFAARWLPSSFEISDHVSTSETSMTSRGNWLTSVEAANVESSSKYSAAHFTSMKSDEGVAGSDWEEFSGEEFSVGMDSDVVDAKVSSGGTEAERSCRRILRGNDYRSTGSHNINGKKL